MPYVYPDGTIVAVAPPDGFVPNFENPERQYVTALYGASIAFNILTVFFVCQRYYVQFVIQKTFRIEDATLLIAWAFIIAITALILRTCVKGWMGTHAYEMPIQSFADYNVAFYPMPILYPICILFAKMSLLFVYQRLNPAAWFRYSIYFAMFFVVGCGVGLTFATAFPCHPVRAAWDIYVTDYKCIDRPALYKATAITGLIADIFMIAIPIPMVLKLQMRMMQKIGLVVMFGVGILTIFTSCMRLAVVITQLSNPDITWGSAPTAFWLVIEANLMIICACLTTLRKFYLRLLGGGLSGSGSNNKSGTPGHNGQGGSAPMNRDGSGNELVTFGGSGAPNRSKKHGNKYYRFDDTDLMTLQTYNDIQGGKDEDGRGGRGGRGVHGETGRREKEVSSQDTLGPVNEDDDSEKGIVQTRTYFVSRTQEN